MKYLISLYLAIILLTGNGFTQNPQIQFDEANDLLSAGKFEEALHNYKQIEESGSVSGALYLNMGIVASQIDSMGLAKYYFLKAAEFKTTHVKAWDALEYTESQFSRQSAQLPKLPWERAVEWLIEKPGTVTVFLIGFFLVLIAMILTLLKWFKSLSFTKLNQSIITSTIIGILIILLSFYVDYVDGRYQHGVVIAQESRVLNRADESADIVSLAYEGYAVTIDARKSADSEQWIYIRLGNGQFGWIKPESLKIL